MISPRSGLPTAITSRFWRWTSTKMRSRPALVYQVIDALPRGSSQSPLSPRLCLLRACVRRTDGPRHPPGGAWRGGGRLSRLRNELRWLRRWHMYSGRAAGRVQLKDFGSWDAELCFAVFRVRNAYEIFLPFTLMSPPRPSPVAMCTLTTA